MTISNPSGPKSNFQFEKMAIVTLGSFVVVLATIGCGGSYAPNSIKSEPQADSDSVKGIAAPKSLSDPQVAEEMHNENVTITSSEIETSLAEISGKDGKRAEIIAKIAREQLNGDEREISEQLEELKANFSNQNPDLSDLSAAEIAVLEDKLVEFSQRQLEFATGDKYEKVYENNFLSVDKSPFSTFSVDVDTASYSKVRQYLNEYHQLPPPDAVRIEELVNYFNYDYDQPTDEHPFATNVEVAECPWTPEHKLVRVALQGKTLDENERPAMNLVFLIDVSGSMGAENKLPLLKKSLYMLVAMLNKNDRISIVAYASNTGVRLKSTAWRPKEKHL